MKHDKQGSPAASPPPIGAGLRTHLGEQLRRIYDQTLTEPIPDRFTALVEQLERAERSEAHRNDEEGLDGAATPPSSRDGRGFQGDAR